MLRLGPFGLHANISLTQPSAVFVLSACIFVFGLNTLRVVSSQTVMLAAHPKAKTKFPLNPRTISGASEIGSHELTHLRTFQRRFCRQIMLMVGKAQETITGLASSSSP